MIVVIPLSEFIEEIVTLSETFSKNSGFPATVRKDQAQKLVQGLVEDFVETYLKWVTIRNNHFETTAEQLFDWWTLKPAAHDNGSPRDHYWMDVIEDVYQKVGLYLDPLFPQRTWDLWFIRTLPGGDVVLEQGSDYRVVDWERRIKTGEWKHGK